MGEHGTCSRIRSRIFGVEARFVDPADPEDFAKATDDRTRCYYAETLPNPKLNVFPIKEVADIGRGLGVPLIMDNTACPIICRPFDHGAAVVMYSTTKYLGGHGTSIGGLLVDGGNFDWEAHKERFPTLNEPDPSYHGAVWTEAVKPLGPIAFILRARVVLLRDVGAAPSPYNSFQTIQGLETLPLRMRAHCENAVKVADYLVGHDKVETVIFPNRQDGEMRRRADAYMDGGYGALVGFELAGGKEAGAKFIDSLNMFYHVANIGDARSLAIHPATHHPLAAQRRGAGADRRDTRLRALVGRHRAHRRHHRRSRPGVGGNLIRPRPMIVPGSFPTTRLRRNRRDEWNRRLVAESRLGPEDLILPVFVVEGENKREPVASMPGIDRLSCDLLVDAVGEALDLRIPAIAIFPEVDAALKTPDAAEAVNPENLVCRAIRAVKSGHPDMGIVCDAALDPFNSDGHDGIVRDGEIINDESVEVLCRQSVVQADAGCEVIAPSDMMDGRVSAPSARPSTKPGTRGCGSCPMRRNTPRRFTGRSATPSGPRRP